MAVLSSRYVYEGTETTETSIVRTGSPADPTGQQQSRKIITTANSQWLRPFQAEPYVVWNPTAGANVDVTVYGTVNSGSLPLNDEIFMEVEYLRDGGPSSPVTSYSNPGGQGNRLAIITISTTAVEGNGWITDIIDGTSIGVFWWNDAQTGREIVFDFGVGASKFITEFTWEQNVALGAAGHGTWCFEGSNNGSSYTTFPETFVLGANVAMQIVPITNLIGYRYYRLRQISGVTSSTPYLREITFKIGTTAGATTSSIGKLVTTTKSNVLAAPAAVSADGSSWSTTTLLDSASAALTAVSASGLVAASTSGASNECGARCSSGSERLSGKFYFEATVTTVIGGSGNGAGVCPVANTFADMNGTAVNGVTIRFASGGILHGGTAGGSTALGAISAGGVVGIAIDLDNRMAWYRIAPSGNWNGTGTPNPATNTGGVSIPAGAMAPVVHFGAGGSAAGNVTTVNFGASSFIGAVPSGFTGGWPSTWTPFKLTTTLNAPQPGLAGYINARIRAAKPSTTFYIDPTVVLTPAGGGTNNVATAYTTSRYTYEGTETTETSITRVGGAQDPTLQKQSRKIITSANSQWLRPFKAEPYAQWNNTIGSDLTVSVCGTVNSGSLPLNDEIWMDCEYLTLSTTAGDPYWASVKLLLGFEGVNNSSGAPGFTDESSAAHGTASTTNSVISTTQAKFGGSSQFNTVISNGTNTFFTDHSDWNLTNSPFTVEAWVYPQALSGATCVIGKFGSVSPHLGWTLYTNGTVLTFNGSPDGTTNTVIMSGGTMTTNAWQHVCADFDGTKYRLYRNGVMVGSSTTLVNINSPSKPMAIGTNSDSALVFNGYIDEVRLTKGVARYASDAGFAAPTAAFPRSASAIGSPLGKIVSTTKANILATPAAVAADGSSWNNLPVTTFDGPVTGAVTLSNGNLTATRVTSGSGMAISTASHFAGKYYFEMTEVAKSSTPHTIGILLSTGSLSDALTGVNFTGLYTAVATTFYSNNVDTGITFGSTATGTIYSFAIDLTARLVWIRKNGGNWNANPTANPATGTNGATIATNGDFNPIIGYTSGVISTEIVTANFGQSTYVYTPPSGFLSWDTGWKPFKLTTTLNFPQPGVAGYIHTRVRAAKPSTTFYIDPQITVAPYSASAAFLARTSGLDTTHVNAYTALIDGLVTDGIWSKLDMLHVYATQDGTNANINLIGNIYNAVPTNSPAFTTDRGYTGDGSNKHVRTGFIPSSAVSPKFVQDSGHVSVWSLTDFGTSSALIMGSSGAGSDIIGMHARFWTNNSYYYVNDASTTNVSNTSSLGHFLANRSTSSATQGYKNGSSVVTNNANTSVAVNAREIYVAGQNQNGTVFGAPYQVAMASIGSSLSSTDVTNFYNRLRTYMTAVGVP